MDLTRCLHCGERLIPALTLDGWIELKCIWCDNIDPLKTEAAKWVESPLCAYRKSSPSILVMQSTQDRTAQNAPRCLGGT